MLESLVANVLNKTLGSYVENFDPKQLNIGIWSGDVKLSNLKLKKESLENLKLPIDVKFGHLGELTLQIPWSNLKGKPVKIIIDDVYLLVSPRLPTEFNLEEEKEREQRVKKEKLNTLEMIEKANASAVDKSQDPDGSNESFTESLVTKIVDNLQITIRNIHLRYEDDSAFTDFPYAIGMTLSELSAVSTNDSWIPDFISGFSSFTHKLMTLDSLSLYWHTDNKTIYNDDPEELLASFQELINRDKSRNVQYILNPVSGNGKFTLNKKGATETNPQYDLQLDFDEFGLNLDSNQYRDILWTTSQINWYLKTHKYRKLKPNVPVKEDPKRWLKYAAECVFNEIHEKNYKWTWEYFKKRRDQRLSYIKLWKLKIANGGGNLPASEQLALNGLETELNYEDIKFYRSLAKVEYKKENRTLPSPNVTSTAVGAPQQQGWLSSWWGGNKPVSEGTSGSTNTGATEDLMVLSEEQRKELYDAIEFDEHKAISEAIDLPRDRVKSMIRCRLNKGSFAIKKQKFSDSLAEIVFEGCNAEFLERPDSYMAIFKLNELRVEDGTEGTLYKYVVNVKPLGNVNHGKEHGCNDKVEPFFQFSFEKNPLDESADSVLLAKMNSMTIFHNPKLLEDVYKFFKPPKVHLDTIELIMNVAESKIDDFTKQTRVGLQYVFDEHKTMNVKMDLQAPLIIVPVNPGSWSSPVAILDAGHISIVSDLVDKEKYETIKNESKENYTDSDWQRLNSLLYDKFNLMLQDAQILIGSNIKSTIEQLHSDGDKPALILENLNMKFLIGVSIIPSIYNLPRIKIGGDVPRFKAMLNDYQYKIFMQLIDNAIPNFDLPDDPEYGRFNYPSVQATMGENVDPLPYDSANGLRFNTFNAVNTMEYVLDRDISRIVDVPDIPDTKSSVVSANDSSSTSKQDEASEKVLEQQRQQHGIEFDFSIDTIELSMSRCTNADTLQSEKLVDLNGKSLKLFFYKTETDMHVDLNLNDLQIEDHIEVSTNSEFKHIISSYKSSASSVESVDLFKLNYHRAQRLVEFEKNLIEVFDQDIKMDIADFKVIVTRKSLLTLLNFALNTFTDPNAPETPADQLRHNNEDESEIAPQHINVDINLKSIMLVLNDDGIKLATMVLKEADIAVLVLPVKMKVNAKLGGVSLQEEVEDLSAKDSHLRRLITMDGDDLAELYYETFDPETNKEAYSSLLKFNTGSMRIMFVENAYSKIFSFLSQFQRMKDIYDHAREVAWNQNYNLENANLIKFDVLIKTPIIVFPQIINPLNDTYDSVVLNLGEIYANNDFVHELANGKDHLINLMKAGIRNTRVESTFHFNEETQKLQIIDEFDLAFDINYLTNPDIDRPTIIVKGGVQGNETKLTELQAHYILQIAKSIPRVFGSDNESSFEDIENDATNVNTRINPTVKRKESKSIISLNGAIATGAAEDNKDDLQLPDDHVKVDLEFNIPILSLSLYDQTKNCSNIQDKGLSKFALNDTGVKMELKEDGKFSSDLHIRSFVVHDIRENRDNKFPEIIPEVSHTDYQFMASANLQENQCLVVDVSVDSPKVILALDYLFALKSFADVALSTPAYIEGLTDLPDTPDDENTVANFGESQDPESEMMTYSFSINIVESSIILLTNPTKIDSEAIVFKISQVELESNKTFSLKANGIGMFLCKMDSYEENRLRIIDDFSTYFFMDSCGSSANRYLTKIKLGADALLIRVSLRDILLAMETFNRASEMYSKITGNQLPTAEEIFDDNSEEQKYVTFPKTMANKMLNYAASSITNVSHNSQKSSNLKEPQVIIQGEELKGIFQGMRIVLIGDVHELPVIDMRVNPFEFSAKNWSTDLEAFTNIETYINIFNYSNSIWEPLLEPWSFNVHAMKVNKPNESITVDLVSHKSAEFVVTSRSIALLSNVVSVLSEDNKIRPRDEDAPYHIINQTGYDLNVWIDRDGSSNTREQSTLIKNDEEKPWQFEDWRKVRESLDTESESTYVGVELVDSPYDAVRKISFKREGENVFMLTPAVRKVHTRLACEIVLGEDKVKRVYFKSTITIRNTTQTAVIVGSGQPSTDFIVDREVFIPPGESRALPVDSVYFDNFAVRPAIKDQVFGWSKAVVMTKDESNRNVPRTVAMNWVTSMRDNFFLDCPKLEEGNAKNYYFRTHASYNSNEGLTSIYPHMDLTIAPPFEIENLLPCDIKWKVHQENNKKSWVNLLRHGESCSVHVVDMSSNLLLQVTPMSMKYGPSTFAVINNPTNSSLKLQSQLIVETIGDESQKLHFKIHYVKNVKSGLKVQIYAPYLILNRTSQKLCISDRNNNTLVCEPKGLSDLGDADPDMFSFVRDSNDIGFIRGNLKENYVSMKVGDSEYSKPVSVDKIGQTFELRIPLKNRELENVIGIHITEGEGKYNMTKVVHFAPRYVMRNNLKEGIQVLKVGTTKPMFIDPGEIVPLYEMTKSDEKQLLIGYANAKSDLSAPFGINDIGEHYIRVLKAGSRAHSLLRVVLTIENATLFIDVSEAAGEWPYSLRNFSDYEFLVYQSDPYMTEDGTRSSRVPFKPIYYKIPAKSVMPYAWDYPAAKVKELVIKSGPKERNIQLAEMGSLLPMKLPSRPEEPKKIVDLNVIADGVVQSLIISNYEPSLSLYKLKKNSSASSLTSSVANSKDNRFETIENDDDFYTRVILRFEGFDISLVNAKGQELCYTTMRGIELRYNESKIYQNISLKVKWIQIDNQLYSSIYPIILFPTVVPKSTSEMADHPTFSASISRLKDDSHGVSYIKFATVLLQELTIEVDEDFLFVLLEFSKIPGAAWNTKPRNVLWDHNLDIPEPSAVKTSGDFYFEALLLQPVQFNLSFVRTERINAEDTSDAQNLLTVALNVLTMAIGNINDAPVRLSSLSLENIRAPLPYLISNIQEHYQQAFLYQIYKVLGSADVLGNPVGLFSNISSGVVDIFYEPYQGFIMTDRPQELGIGLAKGGLSFLKKSVFGFSDSFAKFTGSMAKGLTVATLDKEFQERRRLAKQRNKPKHPLYGFSSGATSLVDGISSGISGIAMAPVEGANKEGAVGFIKGIGKGLIGLPTKSATGLFDFASNISESIRNTTVAFDGQGLDRVRLPRYVSYDGSITRYSEREAQGQFWLKSVDGGKFFDDQYLAHVMLPGQELCVIVSMNRILIISIVRMSIEWEVKYNRIGKISLENTGIIIKQQREFGPERFVAIPNATDRRFLYNKIAVAVTEYNKRCQVIL